MCNRYVTTRRERIDRVFPGIVITSEYPPAIGPRQQGPFIMSGYRGQVGQWGLIPWFAKTRTTIAKGDKRPLMTNNCRSETMATLPTFRDPWKNGQRCLVPADVFMEPYWGSHDEPFKKTVWWAFARADGEPWMIAGLWNNWTDPETGEIVPSYTMVTMNADDHPLMKLMHKPDPTRPPAKQDKRSVVPLAQEAWDVWLHGSANEARAALKLPPLEEYHHGAEDPAKSVPLPI